MFYIHPYPVDCVLYSYTWSVNLHRPVWNVTQAHPVSYMARHSKWQLQIVAKVLKGVDLKCHFLCMVLNGLLSWAFVNQRPSIFVSKHRQTKKTYILVCSLFPSLLCSCDIWVARLNLSNGPSAKTGRGRGRHPIQAGVRYHHILLEWPPPPLSGNQQHSVQLVYSTHLSQMTWGDSPSHFCTRGRVVLRIMVMPFCLAL